MPDILRIHQRQLDDAGVPAWHPRFAARMERIKARPWWESEVITAALRQQGYGQGLEILAYLRGCANAHLLCGVFHISYPTLKKRVADAWDAAYAQFHQQYPLVIEHPWFPEVWARLTGGD